MTSPTPVSSVRGRHRAVLTLGVLSLILWSLTLIIFVKYLIFVMRADNKGEGGIRASV